MSPSHLDRLSEEIAEAAYQHGWCSRFGLPCDGGSADCCKSHRYVEAVSLENVKDVLRAHFEKEALDAEIGR